MVTTLPAFAWSSAADHPSSRMSRHEHLHIIAGFAGHGNWETPWRAWKVFDAQPSPTVETSDANR